MRIRLLYFGLAAMLAALPNLVQASPTAASIGIKFAVEEPAVGGATDETSEVEGAAGVLKTVQWNNFELNIGGPEPLSADVKGTRTATNATVEWVSNNTWSSDLRGTEDTNDLEEGEDRALMLSYLDTNANDPLIVTVSGLDATYTSNGYDVYVYIQGGILDRGGDYTIGNTTFEHSVVERFDGTFIKGVEGNYLVFENLKTTSFDLEAQPQDRGNTTFRAVVNAIEIAARTPVGIPGDYNLNGSLDAGDLDLQSNGIASNDKAFDLNSDGNANYDDRVVWVKNLKKTWIGDANLDGEFNSGDFVAVFTVGKYENGQAASWTEGDWNGDKKFDSGDFVVAFQDGGFEKGPLPAVNAVPEPTGGLALLLCVFAVRRRIR